MNNSSNNQQYLKREELKAAIGCVYVEECVFAREHLPIGSHIAFEVPCMNLLLDSKMYEMTVGKVLRKHKNFCIAKNKNREYTVQWADVVRFNRKLIDDLFKAEKEKEVVNG